MKNILVGLCSALLLSACAGVRVSETQIASGAVNPKAIYIRPFTVDYARYHDRGSPNGAVRKSLAPTAFANALQEELSKIAPAMVLADNEVPTEGWLVEGEIDRLDALSPASTKMHVRVTDLDGDRAPVAASGKETVSTYQAADSGAGTVIYEFDLKGRLTSPHPFGSLVAPGASSAVPFAFRNAAERVYLALSPDPFRYGVRSSPAQRD